jgi:hypothetical protein
MISSDERRDLDARARKLHHPLVVIDAGKVVVGERGWSAMLAGGPYVMSVADFRSLQQQLDAAERLERALEFLEALMAKQAGEERR